MLMWALPILLRSIPLSQIVLIIGCALAEMKILVYNTDNNVVSGCVCAILALLRPLKWTGSIVVRFLYCLPLTLITFHLCSYTLLFIPMVYVYLWLQVPMPYSMPEFVDTIGCCLVGLNRIPDFFELEKGMILIDLKEQTVRMDNADVVSSDTFVLPQANRLVSQLKPLYTTILNLTKTRSMSLLSPSLNF